MFCVESLIFTKSMLMAYDARNEEWTLAWFKMVLRSDVHQLILTVKLVLMYHSKHVFTLVWGLLVLGMEIDHFGGLA